MPPAVGKDYNEYAVQGQCHCNRVCPESESAAYHMGTVIDEICARKGCERPWFVSESSERHCVSNAVASTSFGTPNDNLLGENP